MEGRLPPENDGAEKLTSSREAAGTSGFWAFLGPISSSTCPDSQEQHAAAMLAWPRYRLRLVEWSGTVKPFQRADRSRTLKSWNSSLKRSAIVAP